MIFKNMQTMLRLNAFHGYTRADNFTQPVNINGFQAQLFFHLFPHILTPWLRPENTYPQGKLGGIHAHVRHGIGYIKSIGWCGQQDSGTEILHNHNLSLGLAA